jgi:hypothetical protein
MQHNRFQIFEILGEWLDSGWIEVEQAQDKLTLNWQTVRARLSPTAVARWITSVHDERIQQTHADQQNMLSLLDGWQTYWQQALAVQHDEQTQEFLHRLRHILDEQQQALEIGDWHPLPETSQQIGGPVHQRWLAILCGLVELLANPRWEYERAFSTRWLGDSKAFASDRAALVQYLNLNAGFETLGLIRHTPVVYCWGNWQANCGSYVIDGRAGVPFVALSAETIAKMQNFQISAKSILVIENQTVFETILRPPHRRDDYLYLFSGGFAGYAERHLLEEWLQSQPNLPWYVWTDWDLGGIRIQEHWRTWAIQENVSFPIPFLWERDILEKWCAYGQPLDEQQKGILETMNNPFAEALLHLGNTIEQEAVLHEFSATWLA